MSAADESASTERVHKVMQSMHSVTKGLFDFYEKHSHMSSLRRTEDLYAKLGGRRTMTFDEFTAVIEGWLAEGRGEELYTAARSAALQSCKLVAMNADGSVDYPSFAVSVMLLASEPIVDRMRVIFYAFDIDSDGFVTRSELSSCLETVMRGTPNLVLDFLVHPEHYGMPAYDTSLADALRADLKVTFDPASIPALVDSAFAAADTNRDDKLSIDEWTTWVSSGSFARTWPRLAGLFV